jgi:putative transposase
MIKRRPPRLEQIFQTYAPPLFFITICAIHRKKIEDLQAAHQSFEAYVRRARDEFGVAVERYLIMPDHMYSFFRGGIDFKLTQWVNGLKRAISVALGATKKRPLWQPGFFDHVLRNDESYSQKWEYVRENPVRAELVVRADEWPYRGELVVIDRA